ncbi:MAG: hypothetical protein RLY21_998 [Planctomycetota bacterium]|jgi:hypothetical protein
MSQSEAREQGVLQRVRDFMRYRRGWMFAVPATAFAALVIVAAINLDKGSARSTKKSRIEGAAELLPPQIASAEELARASGASADQTAVSLASGAWIQVADETGRLAQQYSATKLEPLPGSQLSMREPRAVIYLKDGRVLSLASRKGVAYVPRRALESGTLEDDVEVRLFKPKADGSAIDTDRDTPAVVVTADQAQFDGILGEVRCDRAVRVVTDAGSFAGEGLSLVLDADGDGLERLIVDRALEPIRIDRAARAIAARRQGDAASTGIVDAVAQGAQPAAVAGEGVAPAPAPSAPATAAPVAPTTAKPAQNPFYRLVMLGGVEIVRVKDGVRSTITGEELVAVFSLESRGLDDLAFVPRGSSPVAGAAIDSLDSMPFVSTLRAPVALAVVPLAFASVQEAPADSVTVTFGGRLVMLPATDPADQLASQDDIRFDVIGPRVEVVDGRSSSRIVCSRLRYSVRDERVEAHGRDGFPLTVSNPRMTLEGTSFWASLREGEGRLEGGGRMAFARGSARAVSMLEYAPAIVPDAARMLVSADPTAVAMVVDPPANGRKDEFRFDPAAQELEITWKGGVDLRFAGDGDDAKLSLARFGGGVNVFGRQFEMDADSLEVAFSPSDAERIDAIIADGGAGTGAVSVRRLGGDGSMRAKRLELFLGEDAKGDSIPRRLVAKQAIEARDASQTIWTEDLMVSFREKPAGADAAPAAATVRGGALAGSDGNLGDVEIDVVEAKGGVQVLLKEGARVFADTLVGEATKRRLRLTGDNVAIVRSNVVADNLRDLRFDDATRSARSEGPGRFRAFRDPVALGTGKIERPTPEAAPTLEATWSNELDYTELSDARGTLDIRGDVKVRSKPNAQTSDAVDAQSLLLELGIDPKARGSTKGESGGGGMAGDVGAAQRSLDQFIAKGGARLESRSWDTPAREGDPRVFRVTGEHIEYDMRTREGLVVGDGGILVNMPPTAESRAADKDRAPGAITLGRDGTTRFRWKRRMALERQYDDVFKITMENGVEVLHAGARADDTLSMRCDVIEATVRRPLDANAKPGEAPAKDAGDRGVDLGGPAELLGVKGTGGVFIRTPDQDVECGSFDYSVTTGIATLTAAEGRTVTIAVKGQPAPIRAQQVIWDLRNGRLQVLKASGTAGQ